VGWATGIEVTRGYMDISNPNSLVSFGNPDNALGKSTGGFYDVVSLGDGGSAVVSFDKPIVNGDSNDFAVFENSFNGTFLELAFVEISSNGKDFFRFDSKSLTPTNEQKGNDGSLNPDNIHNLAGKYLCGTGTQFDLEELKDRSPSLDINNVNYVKVIDVVGYIEPADFNGDRKIDFEDYCILMNSFGTAESRGDFNKDLDIFPDGAINSFDLREFSRRWLNKNIYGSYDSTGRGINDPFPTPFESGGFDLEAVGVIHQKE
jgi:hypothetical protein